MSRPQPTWASRISCLPRLFGGGHVEIRFDEEYRYLEMLGPLTRQAIADLCVGKWSAFGVLCTMREIGLDPDDPVHDRKMVGKVLRQDRMKMGVS